MVYRSSEDTLDEYLKAENFKFKLGQLIFWGTILFGIISYFLLENYSCYNKKAQNKKYTKHVVYDLVQYK